MTVHVLLPVFNRLSATQTMLQCLRAQVIDVPLAIIVIDDGSTDGTGEFLREQSDVTVLQGNGALWWGGSIDLGIRYLLDTVAGDDWVLFVNNDTLIDSDFVQALLNTAKNFAPAVVGSTIRAIEAPHQLLSVGPRIDARFFHVGDLFGSPENRLGTEENVVQADALSGRGVLYPLAAIRAVGGMRVRWLPHYLADYELALRVRTAGWRLIVDMDVSVLSQDDYGNAYRGTTFFERFFAVRSPYYLPAQFKFWWMASNGWGKFTMPWRILMFTLFPNTRRKL